MHLRGVQRRDQAAILAIQAASPEIAQWTESDYGRVAGGESAGWVAEVEAEVIGFLVARRVASDLEILNFAVRPGARRRGAGTRLLCQALGWGRMFGAENAFLEVRASNLPALEFYERHNFRVTGRRPRYYIGPIEDALLLTAPVTLSPANSMP